MSDFILQTSQPVEKKGSQLIQRYQQLKDHKENFTNTFKEIAEYIAPRRELMHDWDDDNKGKKYGLKVYDPTPIQALIIMANGFYGSSVSQSFKWLKFMTGDQQVDDDPQAKRWFEELEEIYYWELQQSNFYDAGSELTLDGFAFGTAAMWPRYSIEKQKLMFTNLHPKEVFIDTDMDGTVNTFFRPHPISNQNIVSFFDDVPEEIQREAEDRPYKTQRVLHCVLPRTKRDKHKLNAKNKPFASYWILEATGNILKESGFDEFPFAVWRARRDSRSPYGSSPSWEALPSVKSLNMIRKARMLAAQKSVDPALFLPNQMRKGFSNNPGGRNYYNPADYGGIDPSKLIGSIGDVRFDTSIELENSLQQEIKDIFMVDLFLMMQNDQRERTATEILERKGEKLTLLGPTITGFNSEFLSHTVDLIFSLLWKNGRIPPPPDVILESKGGKIDVDFIGPLAQAQRKHLKSQGPLQTLGQIFPLFEAAPETRDLFDWDALMRELSEEGIPTTILRSEEEVQRIRQQRAQEVDRQKAMEAANTMAEGYNKSNEAPAPGSPAEMMMAAQSQAPQEQ